LRSIAQSLGSQLRLWNNVYLIFAYWNNQRRSDTSLELGKQNDIRQVPKHYEIGPRKLNIALTQLWCFASFLNYDLFQVNIVSDPSCRCGAKVMVCVVVHLVNHLSKKSFRPLYIFKHVLKNNFVLFIWKNMITTG
jgi:hypothetical protein